MSCQHDFKPIPHSEGEWVCAKCSEYAFTEQAARDGMRWWKDNFGEASGLDVLRDIVNGT